MTIFFKVCGHFSRLLGLFFAYPVYFGQFGLFSVCSVDLQPFKSDFRLFDLFRSISFPFGKLLATFFFSSCI